MPDTDEQKPARWSFGLDGGWWVLGNMSAMGAIIVLLFMYRSDAIEAANNNRIAGEQAHKDAQIRSERVVGAINELTGETKAARMELQSIRATNERTERVLSGAETPWWAMPVAPWKNKQPGGGGGMP